MMHGSEKEKKTYEGRFSRSMNILTIVTQIRVITQIGNVNCGVRNSTPRSTFPNGRIYGDSSKIKNPFLVFIPMWNKNSFSEKNV